MTVEWSSLEAQDIIDKLGLIPLPEEGGFFRETYRDQGVMPAGVAETTCDHSFSTCIYYLITPEEFSGLHAVKSTEIFHFYAGDAVEMVQITEAGELSRVSLGHNFMKEESPQVIVRPYIWQGTKLKAGGRWALLGCTVAPGFDYSDFLNGTYSELSKKFPQHHEVIKEYTHS